MRFAGGASDEGPSIEFWENRLEEPVQRLIDDAQTDGYMERWVAKRKPAEVAMRRHLLGLPADAARRDRKAELRERADELRRYVLPSAFACEIHARCARCGERAVWSRTIWKRPCKTDGGYNTAARIFAIYDRTWPDLKRSSTSTSCTSPAVPACGSPRRRDGRQGSSGNS